MNDIFVWVYLIGLLPAFLLLFRRFYMEGRRYPAPHVRNIEIAFFAVIKAAFMAAFWPAVAALLSLYFFVRWSAKLLIRVMRLPFDGD